MNFLSNQFNICESLIIENLRIKPVSYCYRNIVDTEVPLYQKKIFNKFQMTLNQFCGDLSHSEFMDYIMKHEKCDIYIYFDIDCIPLKKGLYEYMVSKIKNGGIIGIEQCAGIANDSCNHIYAGPACFGISRNTYELLNCPSFNVNKRSDVAQELTHLCEHKNVPVYLFKHKYSKNYKWNLGIDKKFGNATQYEDWLYHQFEIKRDGDNNENIKEFIEKCQVLL